METSGKKRVLSGIQPTGQIHIGNYLGAVKQWVRFQDEYDCVFSIVDLHAITIAPYNPAELKKNTRELVAILIACGIDPEKSVLFVQSDVHEHAELAWMLNCVTPLGWLNRMTQFKEKSGQNKENASVGLFTYPALQAADILLYDTDLVPVGEDQKQHIEISRDITQRFNHLFGETFKMPDYFIPETAARVMGLDDPTKKMSKSEEGSNHAIYLLDEPDVIRRKIKRAVTDSERGIVFDKKREGLFNLLNIYAAFAEDVWTGDNINRDEMNELAKKLNLDPNVSNRLIRFGLKSHELKLIRAFIENRFRNKGYKELKQELGDLLVEKLTPIRERFLEIKRDKKYLSRVLYEGAQKAREICAPILKKAKKAMGLGG
ncbi:MAG: tryptophan--tRNA ligase [Planctomycetes bacterium]|nr:tryptophan--tRNA ligase [Planctomycetota bacterium]